MIQSLKDKKQYELGMACAILCALVWGVLPIYWKALDPIDSLVIIFYRIVLTCIIVFIASLAVYKWKGILEPLKKKGAAFVFFAAGCIISVNWGLYIWMVNAGFIIQTSIGYYIEPLMVCVFGILFFKEKPERYKIAAILLALLYASCFSYGQIPVLALVLALAFATYAALKRSSRSALLALFMKLCFWLLFP